MEKERVNVSCSALGDPPATITWMNSDTNQVLDDLPGSLELKNSTVIYLPFQENKLTGYDVMRRIRCLASNVHGSILSPEIYVRPSKTIQTLEMFSFLLTLLKDFANFKNKMPNKW